MLHRPGKELENLMPDYLERLLLMIFHSWKMHKKNTTILLKRFVTKESEVLYLEELAAESLTSPEIREQFIEEYLDEAKHSWTPN